MRAYDTIRAVRDRIKENVSVLDNRVYIDLHEASNNSFPFVQIMHVRGMPKDDAVETFDTRQFNEGNATPDTVLHLVDITVFAVSTDDRTPAQITEDIMDEIHPLLNITLPIGKEVQSVSFVTGELRPEFERFPGLSKAVWRTSSTYGILVQER